MKRVLILGGSARAAMDFGTWHREELGITRREQIVPVTSERQLQGRRGETLIVLWDCVGHSRDGLELVRVAKAFGLVIEGRSCEEGR